MPSQRLEKIGIVLALCAILAIVVFNDWFLSVAELVSNNPKSLVWGGVGTLIATVFTLAVRIILALNDAKTVLFQTQLRQGFDTGVAEIKRDLSDVREDLSDMRCAQIRSEDRLARVEASITQINAYSDEKKRRWNEWDAYWDDIKGDFESLRNNDVYKAARILKDMMRMFTNEILQSDLKKSPKDILAYAEERGRAYVEDAHVELRDIFPGDFVDMFVMQNLPNRDTLRDNLAEILEKDKINSRTDGIYLASRQFLRRTHNALYHSWSRYSEMHADRLATDPLQRYFKPVTVK